MEKNAAKQPTAENKRGKGTKFNDNVSAWIEEIDEQKEKHPPSYRTFGEAIPPQYAIQLLDELTNGNSIICTGVGQHQMWAAQYCKHKNPRHWLSSSGLGAMGFGLPAAMGAALAKPDAIVVDIDGDGSFMMNIQELATIRVENLPVKIMLLNNQHLGMVYQFEYEYGDGDSLHSYMGNPSNQAQVFPDMLMFAEACNITAARVTKKSRAERGNREDVEDSWSIYARCDDTPSSTSAAVDSRWWHFQRCYQRCSVNVQQMQFYCELSSTNTMENKK